jgi:hypothetical protein
MKQPWLGRRRARSRTGSAVTIAALLMGSRLFACGGEAVDSGYPGAGGSTTVDAAPDVSADVASDVEAATDGATMTCEASPVQGVDSSIASCLSIGMPDPPLVVCVGGADLELVPVAGKACQYRLLNPPAYDRFASTESDMQLNTHLLVGMSLPCGQGWEPVALLPGNEDDCAGRLESTSSAWFIEYKTDFVEIGFCSCTCARLMETGATPRVIYGCGGSGVWMG